MMRDEALGFPSYLCPEDSDGMHTIGCGCDHDESCECEDCVTVAVPARRATDRERRDFMEVLSDCRRYLPDFLYQQLKQGIRAETAEHFREGFGAGKAR